MKDQQDLLDQLDLQVREDRLVLLGPSDPQEDPAPRGPPDLLERRECLVRKVLLARLVVMESKAQWVCLALLDPPEYQGRTETRVRLESMDRREAREIRESMVLLVHQGQWVHLVSLVLLVLMESWEPGASRGLSGPRETKEPEDSQGPQAPSGYRDCLDLREKREKQAMSDLWVLPGLLAPVALPVPAVLTVPKVLQVVWVTLATRERREILASQDPLELEESQERRVLVESVVTRERRDNLVLLDQREEEEAQEMTDPKETQVQLVSLVILVLLVKLVPEVKMEQRERGERMVNKDKQVPLDLPGRTDLPAQRERGVLLEPEGQRDDRVRREPRESQVLLGPQERRAPSAPRANQENQELRV